MLVRALTNAAGRLVFRAGEVVDLDAADVKLLAKAGAVTELKADEPEANDGTGEPADRTE